MLLKTIARVAAVVLCVLIFSGCKREAGPAPVQEEQVKTQAEYKAEADKEITEQNMNQELDKLEKDVDAEASQTP